MIPGTLVLREYQAARVGITWDPNSRIVPHRVVALLELHQRATGKRLFELGHRSIKATNWVGVIGVGKHCIEVIPKIDEPNELKARENLLHMIARAGLVPLTAADIARLGNTNKPLLSAYMELYIDHLAREWRKGQIKRYILREENRTCLKGKLLLPDQLRTNLLHQERFYTAHDEFTSDNSISRLLKAALQRCHGQTFSSRISQKARLLLADFDEVSDLDIDNHEIERIQVDRTISRFEPLLNMAKFIIKHLSPSPAVIGSAVYSLMFDMNVVFERFIAAEMKVAFRGESSRVRYPAKGKSLLQKDGRRRFALEPDIGIWSSGRFQCLVDTKWKRLDQNLSHSNVSRADIYQMYAYGKRYDVPKVILLYPHHSDLPKAVADYQHSGDEPSKRILVRTIDVSEPLNHRDVTTRLRKDLREMVIN